MSKKKQILLFFGIIISAFIFMPLFGSLYENFFGPSSSSFWSPSHPEYFMGFIFSFLFFSSFLSWFFVKEKKNKYCLAYSLPFLIFMLWLGSFEELIIGVGLVLFGWLLAQGVLAVKAKMGK